MVREDKCKEPLRIELQLNAETFRALLEGKKLRQRMFDYDLTIYPPHYGVFLTHAQIKELRYAANSEGARRTFEILLKIMEQVEDM